MTANNFNYTKQNGVVMKARERYTKQNGVVKRIVSGWTKQNGVVEQVYAAPSLFARFISINSLIPNAEYVSSSNFFLPYMDNTTIIFSAYEQTLSTGSYDTRAYINNSYFSGASATNSIGIVEYFWARELFLNYDSGNQTSFINAAYSPNEVPLSGGTSGIINTQYWLGDYNTTIAKKSSGEYVGLKFRNNVPGDMKLAVINQNGVTLSNGVTPTVSKTCSCGIGLYDGRGVSVLANFNDTTKACNVYIIDYDGSLSVTLDNKKTYSPVSLSITGKSTTHNPPIQLSNMYTDDGILCYFMITLGNGVDPNYNNPGESYLVIYNSTTKQIVSTTYFGIDKNLIGIYNGSLYIIDNNLSRGSNNPYLSFLKFDKTTLSQTGIHNITYSELPYSTSYYYPGYVNGSSTSSRACNSRYIGIWPGSDYFVLLDLDKF